MAAFRPFRATHHAEVDHLNAADSGVGSESPRSSRVRRSAVTLSASMSNEQTQKRDTGKQMRTMAHAQAGVRVQGASMSGRLAAFPGRAREVIAFAPLAPLQPQLGEHE